jgi:small subunit ribosomal protein S7
MTSAQSTKLSQILQRDEEGREKAPAVIKEEIDSNKADAAESTSFANLLALGQIENIATGGHGTDPVNVDTLGHKYGLPELPLPKNANFKYRYDPIVSQVTNLLMKDGKLGVAQRVGPSVSLLSFCVAVLRRLLSKMNANFCFAVRICHSF